MRAHFLALCLPLLVGCSRADSDCVEHDDDIPTSGSLLIAEAVDFFELADGTRLVMPITSSGDFAGPSVGIELGDLVFDTVPRVATIRWRADKLPAEGIEILLQVEACPAATQRMRSYEDGACTDASGSNFLLEQWTVIGRLEQTTRSSYMLIVDAPRLRMKVEVGWIYRCEDP